MSLDQMEATLAALQVAVWVLMVLAAILLLAAAFVFLRFDIFALMRQKSNVKGGVPAAAGIQRGPQSGRLSRQLPGTTERARRGIAPGQRGSDSTAAPRSHSSELTDVLSAQAAHGAVGNAGGNAPTDVLGAGQAPTGARVQDSAAPTGVLSAVRQGETDVLLAAVHGEASVRGGAALEMGFGTAYATGTKAVSLDGLFERGSAAVVMTSARRSDLEALFGEFIGLYKGVDENGDT